MSKSREAIIKALEDRGFTGWITVRFDRKEELWYCTCDQMRGVALGYHVMHAIGKIAAGEFDKYRT